MAQSYAVRTPPLMSKRSTLKEAASPVAKRPKMANGSAGGQLNGVSPRLNDIDEDLHSRQLAVYGRGAMRRMAESNVLIVGLGGLGVETGVPASATDICRWLAGILARSIGTVLPASCTSGHAP